MNQKCRKNLKRDDNCKIQQYSGTKLVIYSISKYIYKDLHVFCLQYDLSKFCPYNTVLVDHGDPSINTGECDFLLVNEIIFVHLQD